MTAWWVGLLTVCVAALIFWSITFWVWVVKQDRTREREIAALRLLVEQQRAEFVTWSVWHDWQRKFDDWKERLAEKVQHLSEQIAVVVSKKTGG